MITADNRLGFTAVAENLKSFKNLDFPVAIIVTLLAALPTIINKKFSRWQGIALLGVYIAYLLTVTVFADKYLALFGVIA